MYIDPSSGGMRLYEQGRVPNLGKYVQEKGYARFAVSNPPQSEVSWTSIATGLNPGGHGLFDFVHRNPATYAVYPSLLPKSKGVLGGRSGRYFCQSQSLKKFPYPFLPRYSGNRY